MITYDTSKPKNPDKIRIIFTTELYSDVQPGRPLTNTVSEIFGSLESTGLAEFDHIHYDDYAWKNDGNRIDAYLLERCEQDKPDIVFFSYFMHAHWGMMMHETLEKIKSMGIKTVFIWWDGGHYIPEGLADLHIDYQGYHAPDGPMGFWPVRDHKLFCNPGKERDIDISFLGTFYGDRICYCNHLATHLGPNPKYKVVLGGSQRGNYYQPEAYADVYQRSKIVLNFCNLGAMGAEVKGRVFEGMLSGALVLEQDNRNIERWFTPMEHYVPFMSPPDMLEKIDKYLADEPERLKIAKAGEEKCLADYHAYRWWSKVIGSVLPATLLP